MPTQKKQPRKRQRPVEKTPFSVHLYRVLRTLMTMVVIPLSVGVCAIIALTAISQCVQRPFFILAHLTQDPPLTYQQTWQRYERAFKRSQTPELPAEFLLALAQTLSQGRAWTTTTWGFNLKKEPWNLITPHSQEFGIMAFTPQGFALAQHYCIRDHQRVVRKPWYVLGGCPGNMFKNRASPTHSIELAAALMQHYIEIYILQQKNSAHTNTIQTFAAITHLCGITFGTKYLHNTLSQDPLRGIHSCKQRLIADYLAEIQYVQNSLSTHLQTQISAYPAF